MGLRPDFPLLPCPYAQTPHILYNLLLQCSCRLAYDPLCLLLAVILTSPTRSSLTEVSGSGLELSILEYTGHSSKNTVSNNFPPSFQQSFPVHFSHLIQLTSLHPYYVSLTLHFLHLQNLEFKHLQLLSQPPSFQRVCSFTL